MDLSLLRRDARGMSAPAERVDLPEVLGRFIALDDRGRALRATWRPAHGFVNVSIWRDDTCVETFHLTPEDASDLVGFLVGAFAASLPRPTRPTLTAVSPSGAPSAERPSTRGWGGAVRHVRHRLAAAADRLSQTLRG